MQTHHSTTTRRRVFDRYMSRQDERQLFGYLRKYRCPWARRDLAWMTLARHTGLRVGTLVQLTEADGRAAIARQDHNWLHVRAEIAKGGRAYDVPINAAAKRAIQALLGLRRELGRNRYPDSPLIPGRQGGHVTPRTLQARMKMWCEAAGLDVDASPHWLRHTFAKRVMETSSAADPRAVAGNLLGHTDLRSTYQYTLPDREELQRAAREAS